MIYESLIVPSEFPISEREVKRALITYDKVKLIDPSDRDVIPANTFMSSIIGMPLFGMDTGPVRPLGKVSNYDEKFEQLHDLVKPIINEGLVEVISTYNIAETKQFTIGGIPTGGYPLNTQFVFWLYRGMAKNPDFLESAINNSENVLLNMKGNEDSFSIIGGGDGGINDVPALPIINKQLDSESENYLTNIARARLASFIKYSGYCEQKNLVPLFSSSVYGGIASSVLNNTKQLLESDENDKFWINRNRVLDLCHEEYLEDEFLDKLTMKEVLKLRTKAWGRQAKSREDLFKAISILSSEIQESDGFIKIAKERLIEYRKSASDLELERKNIKFKIKCDIGIGVLGGSAGLQGLLSQLQSPLSSIGLTMLAGGIWALEKSKDYIPALRELQKQEEEFKRGAGFGIQDFYTRIKS